MSVNYHFASDNSAPVHPEVMVAIEAANHDHVLSYGDDPITLSATARVREHFGDVEVFFAFNGTGANVLGLAAMTRPYNALICSDVAHIALDECGAPERFTGCKLIPLPSTDGKITPDQVVAQLADVGVEHHVQPRVVAITQATELGTLYSPDETAALADTAHRHGLLLHMDGARICNAAAALGLSLRQCTGDLGVDVLSFGGGKNGLLLGEAVVFFNKALADDFRYIRKQGAQLASKMRYISAQFSRLLTGDLWLQNARHANRMASLLASRLQGIARVEIARPVEANAVFARLPKEVIPRLRESFFFYVWDEPTGEVRLMCSFDTTKQVVEEFVAALKRSMNG